jgi:hypothetical protein
MFGSAISVPGGGDHREYLVACMFAPGMVGPMMGIAVGIAENVRTGIVDRLRALPISRVAVLAGRALSELAQIALGLVIFTVCGLVGWQPHGSPLETAAAYALLVLWRSRASGLGRCSACSSATARRLRPSASP